MSSQAVTARTTSRGPAQLWPLITLPTSALVVWAASTGGEALRWLGLTGLAWAMALPLLVSLEAGLTGMMLFEPFCGFIRRAQYLFLPYTPSDPIHVVTPLITIVAFIILLQRRSLRILTETPLAKMVSLLGLIYFAQIFNPLQGGLAIGFSGALFILVPVAWFYFGASVDPKFARRAMYVIVL